MSKINIIFIHHFTSHVVSLGMKLYSFSFHVNINTDSHYMFIQTAVAVSVCGSHADSTEKTRFPSSCFRSYVLACNSLKPPKQLKM